MLAPNPHSITALIAWLEKQPREEKYDYYDRTNCLAAQYRRSLGESYTPAALSGRPGPRHSFAYILEWIAVDQRTFGGALAEARELEASWT